MGIRSLILPGRPPIEESELLANCLLPHLADVKLFGKAFAGVLRNPVLVVRNRHHYPK